MDLIRAVQVLLDPLIEPTSFHLEHVQPLDRWCRRRFGHLEYSTTLDDGRIVLLGIYLFSAWRTVTAEMWIPDDARRLLPEKTIDSVALHRQKWSYTLLTDGDILARTVATEVSSWLESFTRSTDRDVEISFS